MHCVKDHQTPGLFVKVEVRFIQDLPVGLALKIKVYGCSLIADVPRKRGFSNLTGPKKDDARLLVEGCNNGLSCEALIHNLANTPYHG